MTQRRLSIAELERQLAENPEDVRARKSLLFALGDDDVRRVELTEAAIDLHPNEPYLGSPLAYIPVRFREARIRAHQLWLAALARCPDEPQIACNFAAFLAVENRATARQCLDDALSRSPDNGQLWFECGHLAENAFDRLSCFMRARDAGCDHPNLLAWVALAASQDCSDIASVSRAEQMLRGQIEGRRDQFGDALDWRGDGRSRLERAETLTGNRAAGARLNSEISQHAYDVHAYQTLLGSIALRDGSIASARSALLRSATGTCDFRLSAYGPDFGLAQRLLDLGERDAVIAFVEAMNDTYSQQRYQRLLEAVRDNADATLNLKEVFRQVAD